MLQYAIKGSRLRNKHYGVGGGQELQKNKYIKYM